MVELNSFAAARPKFFVDHTSHKNFLVGKNQV